MKVILTTLFMVRLVLNGWCYTANDPTKTISSDGSFGDTTNAVAYVVAKGEDNWVLTIGTAGGSYTWATNMTISIARPFTIQGASPTSRPTITVTTAISVGIIIACTTLKTITVKDIIFAEWTPASALILFIGSGVDCFRLTNVRFNHTSASAAVYVSYAGSGSTNAGPYGLIDQCWISGSGYGFFIRDNDSGASWGRPMTWGAREAVYIEDCVFTATTYIPGSPAIDSNNGSRYVFRHNTLTNQVIANHGPDTGGLTNSSLQAEVYANVFRMTVAGNGGGTFFTHINYRGGANIIYSNAFSGESPLEAQSCIQQDYYRATVGNGNVAVDRFYPADYVGTQQPGSGNVAAAGQDPNFPTKPWGSVPVYVWRNTRSGTYYSASDTPSSSIRSAVIGGFLLRDRDLFESSNSDAAMPGYTSYTYPHPLTVETAASATPAMTIGSGTTLGIGITIR